MSRDTTTLVTIDGLHLEADVATASSDVAVRGGVVLAHPHPLHGGRRSDAVVSALFDHLPTRGFHTVRFDFRGVGHSEGEYDGGDGERLDVAAAVDFLDRLVDEIWVVGYSFGALVGLSVIEPRVAGWVAVAPPLATDARVLSAGDPRPKFVVVPRHDQFCPPERSESAVATWTRVDTTVVETADHFLHGHTSEVARRVGDWLVERVSG